MLDASETASALTPSQGSRLTELARAPEAVPWVTGDERLRSLTLVRRMGWLRSSKMVEISGWGWAVALHLEASSQQKRPIEGSDRDLFVAPN